jgi:hypothetical protein
MPPPETLTPSQHEEFSTEQLWRLFGAKLANTSAIGQVMPKKLWSNFYRVNVHDRKTNCIIASAFVRAVHKAGGMSIEDVTCLSQRP